jgi:serine/threonine protein kinase
MGDSKTTKTWLGTKPYMSPELFDGRPYDPASCDIFAAGQILYILYAGRFAFDEASLKNAYYNFLLQGKPDYFWRLHEKAFKQFPGFFTPSFKELVTRMIHPDPLKRAKLHRIEGEEVKEDDYFIVESEWFKNTRKAPLEEV